MNLDIDKMSSIEIKDLLKMIMRLMNVESDRVTELQDRVLELEIKLNEKE